jgi:hypothetical protein
MPPKCLIAVKAIYAQRRRDLPTILSLPPYWFAAAAHKPGWDPHRIQPADLSDNLL